MEKVQSLPDPRTLEETKVVRFDLQPELPKDDKQQKKPQQQYYNQMKKKNYSKYDLVKVKVSLGDHFYVFSRFLISRILTFIKIKEKDTIKITLEVKKGLVESNQLEIPQPELEKKLFQLMEKFGYGEQYVNRYQMITKFYQKRVPFIVFIAGTECMGKSTLVTQLGDRINMTNIIQTSIVQKFMNGIPNLKSLMPETAKKENQSDEEIICQYVKTCRGIRKGCNFDIQKCFVDGKPLIVEGSHIVPELFLRQTQNEDGTKKLLIHTPEPFDEEEKALETEPMRKMRKTMNGINQEGSMIIPFLLTISPQSHALCLESRTQQEFCQRPNDIPKNIKEIVFNEMRKYQVIQDYLKNEAEKFGFTILEININQFDETIDTVHDIILKQIEDGFNKGIF